MPPPVIPYGEGGVTEWCSAGEDPHTWAERTAHIRPGTFIEYRCFTDDFAEQGTAIFKVIEVYQHRPHGRYVIGEHIMASGDDYQYYANEENRDYQS